MTNKFRILFICGLLFLFSSTAFAQPNYAIYTTQNYFTQILLDTRDGRIWQSHIAIKDGDFRGTLPLNDLPLTDAPEAGRFILSPTGNMYNFILLDTIDGRTWQVQWSIEKDKRGIIGKI